MHHSFYHSTTSTTTPTHSSQAPTQTSLPDPVIPHPINYEYPFAHHPPLILLIARTPPTTPPTSPPIQPTPIITPTRLHPHQSTTKQLHRPPPPYTTPRHSTYSTATTQPNIYRPYPIPTTQHCPTLLQLPLRHHSISHLPNSAYTPTPSSPSSPTHTGSAVAQW